MSSAHVSVVCVEHDTSLALLPSNTLDSKDFQFGPMALGRMQNKGSIHPFYDASNGIYTVLPWHRSPLVNPKAYRDEEDHLHTTDVYLGEQNSEIGLLPLASAYLLHAPRPGNLSMSFATGSEQYGPSYSSSQLHILLTMRSSTSSFRKPLHIFQRELLKNYTSLAMLSRERFRLLHHGCLPFHLAAVNTMEQVLSFIQDPRR